MALTYNKVLKKLIAAILIAFFLFFTFSFLDTKGMISDIRQLLADPFWLGVLFASYFSAFLARGIAWKLYLGNEVRLSSCMYGLFYSLLLNHLLPVKAGDFARMGILKMREPAIGAADAVSSVIVLRALDTAMLFGMALIGLGFLDLPINGRAVLLLAGFLIAVSLLLLTKYRSLIVEQVSKMLYSLRGIRGVLILSLTFVSWILEAVVIYGVIFKGTAGFAFIKAVWVNSITVAGQIFQITPGGIASYEAVMVFALSAAGIEASQAYTSAIITHGFKYVFTFLAGGAALAAAPVSFHILKKWIKERGR